MKTPPLGLTRAEHASLTGFTSRLFPALAFLREAWLVADNDNRMSVVNALRALVKGHSAEDNRELVAKVLCHRMGQEDTYRILTAAGL